MLKLSFTRDMAKYLDFTLCRGGADEDTIMDHADFNCLNWKEILSLIGKYHKVNSFLVGHDTLTYKNFILPKSLCYCLTRFGIYRTSASGRRGRKATERWKTH